MTKEDDVLNALDKPRAIYSLQQRLDPGNKSTDALQELLMRMRAEDKVRFDIRTGRWSKGVLPSPDPSPTAPAGARKSRG
jgi:hypothetical protein